MVGFKQKLPNFECLHKKVSRPGFVSSPDFGEQIDYSLVQKPKNAFIPEILVNDVYSIGGTSITVRKFVNFYVFRDVKGKQQFCDAGVLFIDFSLVATSQGAGRE